MSSEQEEVVDHPDGSNKNFDANVDQSFNEKGNGPREHAKPRRRRRGKKRKQKKESASTCEAENPEECETELHAESEHGDFDSPEWGSDENSSCYFDTKTDVIIRPINVPKAPLNSTQFIMDDHNDCRFYMSFETPNPYGHSDSHLDREAGDIIEPIGEDAAYIDIDYQYESPQDFDNSAYYDQDFELSYKNNRFEELMRFSRTDLIKKLQSLESRFKELSGDLVKEDPSPVLETLQGKLLELQEKNSYLKVCNTKLTTDLHLENETDGSETATHEMLVRVSVSSVSHDEHESEDSEKEVYEQCNEAIMADSTSEICDKNNEVEMKDCEVDGSQKIGNKEEDFNQQIICNTGKSVEVSIRQVSHNEDTHQFHDSKVTDDGKLLSQPEVEKHPATCTTVVNSEDKKSKHVHSNSRVIHCQPNSLVKDDLRTLNIISSELFHNANQTKCSSSVPLEGGMSPSETSVN